jgi:hypothetical protein
MDDVSDVLEVHAASIFTAQKYIYIHILYRVGGTYRVYKLRHSIVHNILFPTPRVGITFIPYKPILTPDVLCRGSQWMSSLLGG